MMHRIVNILIIQTSSVRLSRKRMKHLCSTDVVSTKDSLVANLETYNNLQEL